MQFVEQAISRLSQSDPIPKLLHEVKVGRMKPTDPGLRAVTESWLGTYRQVLESSRGLNLDRTSLLRVDPAPRLEVLESAGVLPPDHPAAAALRAAFSELLAREQVDRTSASDTES